MPLMSNKLEKLIISDNKAMMKTKLEIMINESEFSFLEFDKI